MARPQKTWEEVKETFPADWLNQLIDLASAGKVEIHFKFKIREWASLSNDLWARFKLDEKEFSETLKDLLELSAVWWFDKVQSSIDMGKDCNATALIFGASNAHPTHFRRNAEKKEMELELTKNGVSVRIMQFGAEVMEIEGGSDE